ncbi:tRNA lysidine(34) synthetase TilS [Verrucomicrobia bacterium]|nr:tRNA lysidine(34) synthetase TilS [Verrucomicrobiota bacterium]MDG1890720.1 tRNA lysidine(34) synthetase TilS [Verrucomicrobiota bacterium]
MAESRPIEERMRQVLSDFQEADSASVRAGAWGIAVSGGIDSMALLHFLHQTKPQHQQRLVAFHFDHQLRGSKSREDAQWVGMACEALGVPCVQGQGDTRTYAKERGLSIEMAARELRHAFFATQTSRLELSVLALGHHADDQVELVLMRLLRGSGPSGLSGMKDLEQSFKDSRLTLWRPFLGLRRSEIETFVRARDVSWREDLSNFSTEYQRHRVRNVLVPSLAETFGSACTEGILRASRLLAAEHAVVSHAADLWESADASATTYNMLPLAVQRELMRRSMIRMGVPPEHDCIESLRKATDRSIHVLPGHVRVRRVEHFPLLEICEPVASAHASDFMPLRLETEIGNLNFDGVSLEWSFRAGGKDDLDAFLGKEDQEMFDADRVGVHVVLRHWREGDRMRMIGSSGSVKLQDLFVNRKVERNQRRQLLIAESVGKGIFWVEGMRIAEDFKVTEQTRRFLHWKWHRAFSGCV